MLSEMAPFLRTLFDLKDLNCKQSSGPAEYMDLLRLHFNCFLRIKLILMIQYVCHIIWPIQYQLHRVRLSGQPILWLAYPTFRQRPMVYIIWKRLTIWNFMIFEIEIWRCVKMGHMIYVVLQAIAPGLPVIKCVLISKSFAVIKSVP